MTLAVYPLVYLPVAASLRSADPSLEEVARGLGLGRVRTFARVTLGQARNAILGGCVLVALVILAEYGAFEILAYRTFTTEIFTEFQVFNVPTACALSLVLVALSIVVLGGDVFARGRGRLVRTGPLAQRAARRHQLGRAKVPVLVAFVALVGLALGVPVGSSIYWIFQGGAASITGVSLFSAGWHTALYSGVAAALATLMALPVALLSLRHSNRAGRVLERSTYLVLAIPGVVIAFALSYFSERYADGFAYQSAPMLILAYAILFFPLALVGVRASVAYAPVSLEEVARSLGLRRLAVMVRVTLPISGPGSGGGVLSCFSCGGDRAHRHASLDADRRADPRHPVLGLPAEPLVRAGGAFRSGHHPRGRRSELRARPLLRSSTCRAAGPDYHRRSRPFAVVYQPGR